MEETKKARMGIIAVLVRVLVSITRRLPEARRLSPGITTLALAGIVLLVAVGSASANGVCIGANYIFGPGDTVNESCTLNATMNCAGTHGLVIGADGVVIDGDGYEIIGDGTPFDKHGIYNYNATNGAYGGGHHNVVIRNLGVTNFTEGDGIHVEGMLSSYNVWQKVENNTIYNCTVHDNSEGFGISFWKCVCNSTIDNCTVYNTTGTLLGSCDDIGAGIRLWGKSNHNDVTNNIAHHNGLAGIYSKKGGGNCYNTISGNTVYENGQTGPNAGFTGGIRLQCKSTDYNTVVNNIVTDNIGPGIFIGGNNCTVENNTVTGSKNASTNENSLGDGLRIDRYPDGGGRNTKVYNNTFCDNEHLDISVQNAAAGTIGDNNTCDTTLNYDDTGTTGCTYPCVSGICGDVNMDIYVNMVDVQAVRNHYFNGLLLPDPWAADVNCDTYVNMVDVQAVRNHYFNGLQLSCC